MPPRIRSSLRRIVDAALHPLGLAIADRALVERARRASYRGALAHARRIGFAPRTVVDVGVARGTPELYEAFPEARHVLVEPLDEALPHIRAIAARYTKVEHVPAAAAGTDGRIAIHVPRDMERASTYWERDFVAAEVTRREYPAVTLDRIRDERRLEAPILLKVDVEGAELAVLEGARDTLAHTEYVILETALFDFHPGAPMTADVVGWMRERGFVPYDVLSMQHRPLDGAVSTLDLAFVKEDGPFRDHHTYREPPRG